MKVLNLYAGIGGNRKLWPDYCKVTAVENNKEVANVYKSLFPKDKIIITDAHDYLLNHFEEFEFIWSSPPCQSHSGTNHFLFAQGVRRFPNLKLYEEIIFLKQWFKNYKWVVENVVSYYDPFIKPQISGRHFFWANFIIPNKKLNYDIGTQNRKASKMSQKKAILREAQIPELLDLHELKDFKISNKRQVLRNAVLPKLGLHVFNAAFKEKQQLLK